MAVDNQNDLLLALERGDYDSVLGTAEGEQIDFKEAPYQLESTRQKWELAKDIAAFANSRGGVIVLGFRTTRHENRLTDTATEHRPIPKTLINWPSYRDIVASWVHPGLHGLDACWFPAHPSIDRGVFVLIIPAQPEESKHFVVCEMTRDDASFPGAIGVPVRNNDAVTWLRPEALQSLVREALWWRRQGPTVAGSAVANQRLADAQELVLERCRSIEGLVGWNATPFIALHALPEQPLTRPDNFYSHDGLRGRIEKPAVLRADGFHISTNAQVQVQSDGSLACGGRRKALWLSPNGFITAAGAAIGDFLGWYINQGRTAGQPLALNPRVTAEFILEFSRFFHRELRTYYTGDWDLWLSIVGFDRQGGVVLIPELGQALGPHASLMWDGYYSQLPPIQPSAHRRVASGRSSGSDAYRLVVELYSLFAVPPNLIPYVVNAEISEEAIVPRTST